MIKQAAQTRIDELDEILELERDALINGHLNKLQALLERKEAVIAELNDLNALEQDMATTVQEKVTRNQHLLESAMQGIRAVSTRMRELRSVRKGLDVYDSAGRKNSFHTSASLKLEKRA